MTPHAGGAHRRQRRGRPWVLPLLVVLVWLLVGGPLGTFAGKLASVQENDSSHYLPQGTESTRVLDVLAELRSEQTIALTVVFSRESGLTPEDLSTARRTVRQLLQLEGIVDTGKPGAPPLIPSEDGEAVRLTLSVVAGGGEQIHEIVTEVRHRLPGAPGGLVALAGGPAGVLADFAEAFSAIDGLLLAVALGVVLVILLVVYRSPVLPPVVLLTPVLSLGVASAVVYALAKAGALTVTGQSQGIMFILTVGAATDYSLLMVARFREELRDHESAYEAMRAAYRGVVGPILASGTTVILGLLCLLLADLASLRSLGPVGALGVAAAVLGSLTLLPAALVLIGRAAYWPFRPRYGSPHTDTRGVWGRVARLVARRARLVWVATTVVLLVAGGFLLTLDEKPVPQTATFLTQVESKRTAHLVQEHFDGSATALVVAPAEKLDETVRLLRDHPGVADSGPGEPPTVAPVPSLDSPGEPRVVNGKVVLRVTLAAPTGTAQAAEIVRGLREDLDSVSSAILVGGQTALSVDLRQAAVDDRQTVIPAILVVILVVLVVLLRALVVPLVLLLANVLSFAATMGVAALVFDHVLGLPGSNPTIVLIGFVFLVALGIDYSIFLMTRVREETRAQGPGPGVLRGLSSTGGVITSAGVVLAATFGALVVIPILFLVQVAFIVGFGVLLDTFVVRSLLVPALVRDLGGAAWWPSRLRHQPDDPDEVTSAMLRGSA